MADTEEPIRPDLEPEGVFRVDYPLPDLHPRRLPLDNWFMAAKLGAGEGV
jgi:hypothetical protein